MEVKAQLNNIRLAPRKVRALVSLVKRKDALVALDQLEHMVRRPSPALSKLIRSAISSAENSYHMVPSNLYIKDFYVNEGVKLKRYMPRAQGRATEIQKKTSRIILVLDERVAGMKQEPKKKTDKEAAAREHKHEHGDKKPGVERELGKKSGMIEKTKRLFSRKSV
jgi:large subunit ribosomal protein L22